MSTQYLFRGNIPALVTPFDAGGEIRLDYFARLVEWHIGQGVDGICVAGDNGEAWSLSVDERRRLAEAAVTTTAGRVPVIMGASATTAKQSAGYADAAAQAGVNGLMIGPQSYVMKASTREMVQRMETIHKSVPLPIVLYNSPRRTNISLTVETMGAIVDAVNVVALKEATRDFFYLTHVIRHFSTRLAVLVGPAPFIIPGLALGAAGFISSGPELLGSRAARVIDLASREPGEELRDMHYAMTRIYETLMALGTWPSALKAAHELIGQPAGVPREPVLPLDPEAVATLARVMHEIGAPVRAEAFAVAAE
jgi:4-hydroxy-tetrahydrodipicolinate synthase